MKFRVKLVATRTGAARRLVHLRRKLRYRRLGTLLLALAFLLLSLGLQTQTSGSFSTTTAGSGSAATNASYSCTAAYKANVLNTTGRINYWRLGETSGTTATDTTAANNGTYVLCAKHQERRQYGNGHF